MRELGTRTTVATLFKAKIVSCKNADGSELESWALATTVATLFKAKIVACRLTAKYISPFFTTLSLIVA